jgi:hypothetical protein
MSSPDRRNARQVSTGNAFSAVFGAFARDFTDLFQNPLAFVGGLGGMLLSCLLAFFGISEMADAAADDAAEDEDEFLIDFEPGALVKLGVKMEETEIPEKIIVQETRAEEEVEVVEEAVTDDDKAAPATEVKPDEPEDKPKKTDTPKPVDKKDKKLPTSKLPTTSNTPYKNDLPTVTQDRGDPFGDPGGWADRAKDGDPWATAVMKSLNNMKVGAYSGKGGAGDFKFQLTICKDGSIKNVAKKGGSLSEDGQNAVRLALDQLDIPKPPADVAKKMGSSCAKIKYTFVWSSRGVK